MSYISQDAIMFQLLLELNRRQEGDLPLLTTQEAYGVLAARFDLTDTDLNAVTPKLKENKWENDVRFASAQLKELGLVYSPERGLLALTDKGTNKLRELVVVQP